MAEAKKVQVAKTNTANAVALNDLLKKAVLHYQREGRRFRNTYLNIIGDTSPQIDKEDSEYIQGASGYDI